ncbi:hypothetical protein DBV05_g11215 [Lasiodiplodia theobromae]|uniref:Secreted protein n=1 Tax=Lasiodiplodia theobromae TaxID=45133 RepID=A0A5N5CXS8_9PEZI|nr:hypothetical protein DBV05_g11215 [Lasiodiplodia theobromae]
MILRGLAGGLLVPLVAAAALRPRQDEDIRPYRILQIDVQARVLLQPIVVDTFVRRATELAVFPGLTIPITNAPTLVDTTVTGTTITHIIFFNVVLYNFEVVIYDILQGFVQRAIILKFYVIINLDFHDIVYKVFNLLDCYVIVDCCPDSTCGESFGSAE